MARCKDCIHFCVCSPYTAPNESYPEVDGCKCFRATADVVPKSEVEKWKEINERLYKEMSERMVEERKIERKLVAREIFEEIDILGTYNPTLYAELKKKYTEGEQ